MRRSLPRFVCSLLVIFASLPLVSAAKTEEWRDTAGNEFKGEPTEIIGPFAIFRTSRASGRRLALQFLPPEACVRLHAAVGNRPGPAADWANADGTLSREILHFTQKVSDGRLVPAELAGRQEPRVYIVFFASHGEGKSWEMMGTAVDAYHKLRSAYPGQVEGLYYGLRHNRSDHGNMATRMNLPWLVTQLDDQRKFRSIERLFPGSGYAMFAVTRDGVPLFGEVNPEKDDVLRVMNEVHGLLELSRPNDPRLWVQQHHYLRAVQPVIYAQGRSDPVLVGSPLIIEALAKHGITRVEATLDIAADGSVTGVTLGPGCVIPERLTSAVVNALEKALAVPAVDHGTFVAGTVSYQVAVKD